MNNYISKNVKGEKLTGLLLLLTVVVLAIMNPFDKPTLSIFLSTIIIILALTPYFLWRRRPDREYIIPGVAFYGFFYLLGYGFPGFVEHQISFNVLTSNLSNASKHTAMILVISHLIIVFSGFYFLQTLFKNKRTTNKVPSETGVNQYRVAWLVCLLLVGTKYIFWEATSNLLFGILTFFAYMYLFYFLFYHNFGGWLGKAIAIFAVVLTQSSSTEFLQFGHIAEIAIILVLISMQKGKILIFPALLLLLGFFVFQPMKGDIRSSMADGTGVREGFTRGISGFQGLEAQDYLLVVDLVSLRIDYTHLLASFVEHIGARDSENYLGWEPYQPIVYSFIPRFIWPDKPKNFSGNEWAVQEGYLSKDDYVTSYNMPWLPEMYLAFGVLGIIFGSLIISIILFLLDKYYWTMALNPYSFAIGYVILKSMIGLESAFAITFGVVIKVVIIDLVLRLLWKLLYVNLHKKKSSNRLRNNPDNEQLQN